MDPRYKIFNATLVLPDTTRQYRVTLENGITSIKASPDSELDQGWGLAYGDQALVASALADREPCASPVGVILAQSP